MTSIHGLTAEQEAFATHVGGAFVHACPGAGKTRTIIARLARIAAALPPRRGVAVLSFTNSAVDEFRERCQAAGLDSLLKHPSFMGTLDAFVRHFVVLPSCAATSPTRPIILVHISEHSDHPFRDYTIADFAIIRSPIPRFSGQF